MTQALQFFNIIVMPAKTYKKRNSERKRERERVRERDQEVK